MFRTFIITILLLILLAFTPYLANNHGSLSLIFGSYKVEISLVGFLLIFIILLAFFYIFEGICRFLTKLLFGWWFNRHKRRAAKSAKIAQQALHRAVEGDYQKASRLFKRSADLSEKPFSSLALALEYAIANRNLELTEELLPQVESLAKSKDDLELLDVLQVKYYALAQKWKEGIFLIQPVLEKNHTKDILKVALEIYKGGKAYGKLEDFNAEFVKKGILSTEEAQELHLFCARGFIEQEREQGFSNLLTWWKNQSRARSRDIVYRLAMLDTLLQEEGKNNEVIKFSVETLRLLKGKTELLETTTIKGLNFLDLVETITYDDLDFNLSRTLEKFQPRFSPQGQERINSIIAHLYFHAQKFPMAKAWVERLLATKNAVSNKETMLLAQVLYRKLDDQERLLGLNNRIDQEFLPGAKAKAKAEEANAALKASEAISQDTPNEEATKTEESK